VTPGAAARRSQSDTVIMKARCKAETLRPPLN
jgi:hypothetical protein